MHDYIFLSVGRVGSSTDLIVQHVEYITPTEKRAVLLDLINTVEVSAHSDIPMENATHSSRNFPYRI